MLDASIVTTEPWFPGHIRASTTSPMISLQEIRINSSPVITVFRIPVGALQHVLRDLNAELLLLRRKLLAQKFLG
jgi:hypothetical protein